MPLIHIKTPKGVLTEEQKKEMVKRVSETVAEVEAGVEGKDKMLPYTWCLIDEVEDGNWNIGGRPITAETVKAITK